MNVFDEWYENLEPQERPRFNVCPSCGRHRSLKPADYCRRCAILHNRLLEEGKYIVVEPQTISQTVERTGISGSFLLSKYRHLHELRCVYVLFFARDQWQDITIDERFHIPTVMKHLFERLED